MPVAVNCSVVPAAALGFAGPISIDVSVGGGGVLEPPPPPQAASAANATTTSAPANALNPRDARCAHAGIPKPRPRGAEPCSNSSARTGAGRRVECMLITL